MRRRALTRVGLMSLLAASAAGALVVPTANALPPASTCVTDCVARFDSGSGTFTVPAGVTSLTVDVAGGAGAVPAVVLGALPTAVGGPGGVAKVDLGGSAAARSFDFGAGGTGEGSWLRQPAVAVTPLVVAGGGGGVGYAGRLDLDDPSQIFASYEGGTGGVATSPGISSGTAGTDPFGASGSATTPGDGTVADGAAGGSMSATPGTVTLGAGGAGATAAFAATHTAGAGGSGAIGGGGGGISSTEIDENPLKIVGAGAGGAGYLALGTATAGTPNVGQGYVTFTWSYTPSIVVAPSSVHPGDTVTVDVAGLPAGVAFTLVLDGTTVGAGTADGAGAAHATATLAADQRVGSFPVELLVDDASVASSAAVSVVAPAVTPTPTPTPTPSSTPTASPSASATPTATPSPSATPSATPSPTASPAPGLAATGANDVPFAALALAFVLAGAVLVGMARRAS
ncbi:MAG: hypothetical protein AAGC49_12175 [Brevundimonas sp.]